MRSGLITEATIVGGSLFVVGAALMQFRQEGITDKKYWPYLGVFITGFSAHLIFEAFGLNKKYCDVAFNADPDDWDEEIDWDNDKSKKDDDLFGEIEWDAESKDEARMKEYEKTYGKEGAKVRNRIFKRILAKAQDGTKAGQWSARKAQSLTEDYEKAMKGKGKKAYKGGKKTKSQKSLKKWGDQKWTTKSGKKSSKTGERYLPKKAIKALSDKEYKETSDKKRKDTKKGKQFSKQPKKVADKVKKYRADDSWGRPMGSYYYEDGQLKIPSKAARAAVGWSKKATTWKSKQQEPKEITEFEKEMIWVENMFNQNRYYCKRYEDIPYPQRKTFSGNNLRRGNRCYNCRSKECPSTLLGWKQAHRLADEADDRSAKRWGVRDELIESGEYPEYLRRDRDSILKDLFGADSDDERIERGEGEYDSYGVFTPYRDSIQDSIRRVEEHLAGSKEFKDLVKERAKGWVDENAPLMNNRYFCKKYEDLPISERRTFSGKNLRRGNRCYNCRSKDCPDRLIRFKRKKQKIAERRRKRNATKAKEERWMQNVVTPMRDERNKRRDEQKSRRKEEEEMSLGDFWDREKLYQAEGFGAEEKMPYGVHVESHKTTSTVFYNRKPFRKYRGNRHREQAQAYASFMESKLKRNPSQFNYYAEDYDFENKVQYIIFNTKQSRAMPTHIIKVRDTRLDSKTLCGMYLKGKGWNVAGVPPKISSKDNPSGLCHKCVVKKSETFEAEGKPTSVEVKRSTNDEKKLMAVFTYPDERTKTTHFGQRGASDYTKHGEKERMKRYLERHGGGTTTSTKEDWKDPTTAGALSRWILWNKPSLSASFNDFKRRFNLNGDLKVKKSAESFEAESRPYDFNKMPAIFKSWRVNTAYCINDGNENTLCGTGDRWSASGHGSASKTDITCRKCISKWKKLTDEEIKRIEEAWDRNGFSAESFEADSCRECGRKEGAYSDTVLVGCEGCPELCCQHCLDEENNGCAFCIKKRAESTSKGLNLVMMGVPGSGKGTQSKLITKAYGWPQIGMGDLIRDNMKRKTPLGKKCEPYMATGSLVPDEVMIELVSQRLKEDDCKEGFILDGFPRTVPQGNALEKITNIDAVFFLDSKEEVVIERLGGRRTCSDCGEIYHQLFQPPKQEGVCELCNGDLFIRPDDNIETIMNRLSVFNKETEPLINFYTKRNLLKNIESNSTPQDVFEKIEKIIKGMLM